MLRIALALAAGLGCCLSGGCCRPGRRLDPAELGAVHPSVRWIYEPGGQIGTGAFMAVPWSFPNYFQSIHLGRDCVIVTEVGNADEMAIAWLKPRYALSLKDGSFLFARSALPPPAGRVEVEWDESLSEYTGKLPNGLTVVVQRHRVLIGRDPGHQEAMAEIPASDRQAAFTTSPEVIVAAGNVVVLKFWDMVICVDGSRLPRAPATRPSTAPATRPTTAPATTAPATAPAATAPASAPATRERPSPSTGSTSSRQASSGQHGGDK